MWRQLQIADRIYFLSCKIENRCVECALTNLTENWCENEDWDIVLERAKQLNKRIKYNEETIRNTLEKEQPTQVTWEDVERTLKLKYRVHNLAFNFEWQLRRQAEDEIRRSFVMPLFRIVAGLQQQIEELKETVLKKDTELRQYKIEGAVLRRTTIATPPFDAHLFELRFGEVNRICEGLQPLTKHVEQQEAGSAAEQTVTAAQLKQEMTPKKAPTKLSPRNRKRKALEAQKHFMARRLNARKQKLVYASSQSSSQGQSQGSVEDGATSAPKEAKDDPKTPVTEVKDEKEETAEEAEPKDEIMQEVEDALKFLRDHLQSDNAL